MNSLFQQSILSIGIILFGLILSSFPVAIIALIILGALFKCDRITSPVLFTILALSLNYTATNDYFRHWTRFDYLELDQEFINYYILNLNADLFLPLIFIFFKSIGFTFVNTHALLAGFSGFVFSTMLHKYKFSGQQRALFYLSISYIHLLSGVRYVLSISLFIFLYIYLRRFYFLSSCGM